MAQQPQQENVKDEIVPDPVEQADDATESVAVNKQVIEDTNKEAAEEKKSNEQPVAAPESKDEAISPNEAYIEFVSLTDHHEDCVSDIVSKFDAIISSISSNEDTNGADKGDDAKPVDDQNSNLNLFRIKEHIEGLPFKYSKFAHSHKSKLIKRLSEYQSNGASKSLSSLNSALIIGAGPAGLRMAINLALLGCPDITVMDRRDWFSRKQIVAIWKITYNDLEALGIRDIMPSWSAASGTKLIPITYLQHFLLRVALMLNVKVITNRKFQSIDFEHKKIEFLNTENWENPQKEEIDNDFDVIIDASGTRAVVRDMTVTKQKDDDGKESENVEEELLIGKKPQRKKGDILGVTANFDRVRGDQKKDMILGKAFFLFQSEFKAKKIRLENIVYFRSDLSNYLVATVKKKSLRKYKVFVNPEKRGRALLKRENVVADNVRKLILQIATEWDIPKRKDDEKAFNRIKRPNGERDDFSLFEFANLAECAQPIKFVPNGDGFQMIACVGDSCQAPFWPKGTGVNHAFIGCYLLGQHLQRWVGNREDEKVRGEIVKKAKQDFDDLARDLSDMNWHRERVNNLYMKDW